MSNPNSSDYVQMNVLGYEGGKLTTSWKDASGGTHTHTYDGVPQNVADDVKASIAAGDSRIVLTVLAAYEGGESPQPSPGHPALSGAPHGESVMREGTAQWITVKVAQSERDKFEALVARSKGAEVAIRPASGGLYAIEIPVAAAAQFEQACKSAGFAVYDSAVKESMVREAIPPWQSVKSGMQVTLKDHPISSPGKVVDVDQDKGQVKVQWAGGNSSWHPASALEQWVAPVAKESVMRESEGLVQVKWVGRDSAQYKKGDTVWIHGLSYRESKRHEKIWVMEDPNTQRGCYAFRSDVSDGKDHWLNNEEESVMREGMFRTVTVDGPVQSAQDLINDPRFEGAEITSIPSRNFGVITVRIPASLSPRFERDCKDAGLQVVSSKYESRAATMVSQVVEGKAQPAALIREAAKPAKLAESYWKDGGYSCTDHDDSGEGLPTLSIDLVKQGKTWLYQFALDRDEKKVHLDMFSPKGIDTGRPSSSLSQPVWDWTPDGVLKAIHAVGSIVSTSPLPPHSAIQKIFQLKGW